MHSSRLLDSDMTAAMQNIVNRLSPVKMTERGTIGVISKRTYVYRLLSVFQCLLMLPLFGVRKISRMEGEAAIEFQPQEILTN